MKRRIGQIQAQRALFILEDVMSDIKNEELRGDLIVQAHDIILDFIDRQDPTMEEVEEYAMSFAEAQEFTIIVDLDSDNDND